MSLLDTTKVRSAIVQRTTNAPAKGGWSSEVNADGLSHYFQLTGAPGEAPDTLEAVSLCRQYAADLLAEELDELDPLAPENCKQCRRLLLEARKLI